MFDRATLANNIKAYRKCNGMTQQDLADRLMISVQSVSKWECAVATPDLEKLCALAQLWRVPVDTLVGVTQHEPCFIGVDGGGTKTEFVLFTREGVVRKRVVKPGSNPNICGVEETVAILKSGLEELFRESPAVCGVDLGIAGLASGDYAVQVSKAIGRQYPKLKITCHSDILNVIASATREENVIAAICGTGSVVYAGNIHSLRRIGGWGYLLDDVGSGYALGRDALRVALGQRDGTGEKSIITDLAEERLGCPIWDAITAIYQGGNAYIASFAPLISAAARQGDPVATALLRRHADGLSGTINHAASLCDAKTLVMSGSIIVKDTLFLDRVKAGLSPALSPIVPALPPVFGSCLSAFRHSGEDTAAIEPILRETYLAIKRNDGPVQKEDTL